MLVAYSQPIWKGLCTFGLHAILEISTIAYIRMLWVMPRRDSPILKMMEKIGFFSKFRHKLTSKKNKFDQLTEETE
jgi:hypothetical protein